MTLTFQQFTLEVLPLGPLETNCYLLHDRASDFSAVVDPAEEGDFLVSHLEEQNRHCDLIVLTHGHYDHIGALAPLAEATGAVVAIHAGDKPMLQSADANFSRFMGEETVYEGPIHELTDGEVVTVGQSSLRVLHTPGHTPGGICLLAEDFVITGDTLFQMGVGRTDFPGGSTATLMRSIATQLMVLPDDLPAFPGHGPATTIGKERRGNPFLR